MGNLEIVHRNGPVSKYFVGMDLYPNIWLHWINRNEREHLFLIGVDFSTCRTRKSLFNGLQ
jgi:hypothetical protein